MILLIALLAVVSDKALTAPEDCCKLYALGKFVLTWTKVENGGYPVLGRASCVLCNRFLLEVVAAEFIRG